MKKPSNVVVVEKYDRMFEDPEATIVETSEDHLIELMDGKAVGYLESIRDAKQDTLIDLAIKYKRKKLLIYLLGRDFNPLAYGSQSLDELSKNSEFKSLVTGYQKPRFYDLAAKIDVLIKERKLNDRLREMGFQTPSCRQFLDLVLDHTYIPGPIFGDFNSGLTLSERAPVIIKALLGSDSCKNLRSEISTAYIAKWLNIELLAQLTTGFSDSTMVEVLLDLGNIDNLAVEVVYQGMLLRLDPMDLLSYSAKLAQRPEDLKKWQALLGPHISDERGYYNTGYFPMRGDLDFGYNPTWLDCVFGGKYGVDPEKVQQTLPMCGTMGVQ